MSSVAARFFPPTVSGIASSNAAVREYSASTTTSVSTRPRTCNISRLKRGPWIGLNWRYDSGLVAGRGAMRRGRRLQQWSSGQRSGGGYVATSHDADQQFEAGLSCGNVHAARKLTTPTTPIAPGLNLCPAADYGSRILKIPAAGTEDDDHNPPRIAPTQPVRRGSIGQDDLLPQQ